MPGSPESWRCFVAVPVSDELRVGLAATVDHWKSEPECPDLRWTDPEGWHLTLAFLGATEPGAVLGLTVALDEAVFELDPFAVRTATHGAFPRPGAAQSVWLGIDDPEGRLFDLARSVQLAVLPPDARRHLRAHLTLGRSRARRGEPLGSWLDAHAFPVTAMPVTDVLLYRSHLGRGPARYEELARLPLGGAGSAGG